MLLLAIESKISTAEVMGWLSVMGTLFGFLWWIGKLTVQITKFTLLVDKRHDNLVNDVRDLQNAWNFNDARIKSASKRINDLERWSEKETPKLSPQITPFVAKDHDNDSGSLYNIATRKQPEESS